MLDIMLSRIAGLQPGDLFGGGYFVGNIEISGVRYALVIAPKASGQSTTTLQWKTSETNAAGTTSLNNGSANTQAMIAAGAILHPAANFCRNLNIGGFNDWYLPSSDELELCYRNLKPSSLENFTAASGGPHGAVGANPSSVPAMDAYTKAIPSRSMNPLFQTGGAESLAEDWYWSSTQFSDTHSWGEYCANGYQAYTTKLYGKNVRAVRKIAL